MRKEFIIAIIFGISIGVIVAFGIWRANTALKSDDFILLSEDDQIQNEAVSENGAQLTIIRPEENDVITSSPVTVSGITKPTTVLIISAENKDYIVKTDEDGSFEQDVDLVGGVNEILFAHQENGDTTLTKSLKLIYSTEFEKKISEQ